MYDANFFKRLFFFQPKLPKGLENNYILKNYFQNLSVKGNMEERGKMVEYIYFLKRLALCEYNYFRNYFRYFRK